ncbi:MAG: ATP-binding protein [Alphaproteobacteria bacterium]
MTSEAVASSQSARRSVGAWLRRLATSRSLTIVLLVIALVCAVATYMAFAGIPPFGADPTATVVLINIDLLVLVALGSIIAVNLVQVWAARRRGSAGSRLHIRLVVRFGLLAIAPTIVVALFSMLFFTFGLQAWFSDQVRTAVNTSLAVAQAYLEEHRRGIEAQVLAMANDLNRAAPLAVEEPQRFAEFLVAQGQVRGLPEAVVFTTDGSILSSVDFASRADLDPSRLSEAAVDAASRGEVVLMTTEDEDRVRALVRLEGLHNAFLYVGREIDPEVINYIEQTSGAVSEYAMLENRLSDLQVTFALIFVMLALLLLFTAVMLGLQFANNLARPISALIGAADRVRDGDLSAHVDTDRSENELATLSRAFNRMTEQLRAQRTELIQANEQIDRRRRFNEAVVAGVSAGVIGLDPNGSVHLANDTAARLLDTTPDALRGAELAEVAPDMAAIIRLARRRPGFIETQVTVERKGELRNLIVRVATERVDSQVNGYVVTFDDITELGAAQRKAAWADVARRIAHEIKNPLTPIQLSAERLKRKYLKQITEDSDTFQQCTDTIVRHVDHMRRMVDEFSAFARMPSPKMEEVDLRTVCAQAIVLQRTAHANIRFVYDLPSAPIRFACDPQQLGQALTNLLQNAIDAIEGRDGPADELPRGEIVMNIETDQQAVRITISDNGRGLPQERNRLTEPYVTTRAKGTGLGLAIVKRIVEDHRGELELADRQGGGASVSLVLPFDRSAATLSTHRFGRLDQGSEPKGVDATAGVGHDAAFPRPHATIAE